MKLFNKLTSSSLLQLHNTSSTQYLSLSLSRVHVKFGFEKTMDEKVDTDEIIEEFEMLTKNTAKIQREILEKILEENGNTEYLNKWGLNGRSDPESFKAFVPIVTHMDFEPYIQRIMDGDTSSVLTKKAPSAMITSSGTTRGKAKFVPLCDKAFEDFVQVTMTSFAFRNRKFPVNGGKALQFFSISKQFKTRGGLLAGCASTHLFTKPVFIRTTKAIQAPSCSPKEVMLGLNYQESLYCHLLCGLVCRDEVRIVFSSFGHHLVQAFRLLEQVWEELCNDIRVGILSPRVTTPSIRKAMMEFLKPNPKLADELQGKCSRLSKNNNWFGLIPQLFPQTKYVLGVMTGSMAHYVSKLRHYAVDIPLVSGDYLSSEICLGPNVNPHLPPELTTYVVHPNCGYFEFMPKKKSSEIEMKNDIKTFGLSEVKIGEEYEVVITNHAGLYRYRLGDVVKVTGFHNSAPQIQFLYRSNLILNINIDKHTEEDLQAAVEASSKILAREDNIEIIDFTSYADKTTDPGHYVIFVELSKIAKEELLIEACDCLDRSFGGDAGYLTSRKTNGIGPLELRVVGRGTFQKILDHYIELGSAATQIKVARCVGLTNKVSLQILDENVSKSYFSKAFT